MLYLNNYKCARNIRAIASNPRYPDISVIKIEGYTKMTEPEDQTVADG